MTSFMKLGKIATGALQILALSTFTAIASPETLADTTTSPHSGIYKSQTVSSPQSCDKLCASDPDCRGTIQHQPDTRFSSLVCSLFDGTNSVFSSPEYKVQPLDLNQAVEDLNAYRAEYGLQPVRLDLRLIEASRIHADDLAKAGIISHSGTDGSTHGQRIKRVGYNYSFAGENVATGQRSWDSVFQAWKDSPPHNDTLLHPDVSDFGIALVEEPKTQYRTYWAMLLTKPMDMGFLDASNLL